jgi:hypothetical protein
MTFSEPTAEIEGEKVKFLLYDSAFAFDSTSKISLSGYYRVREVFGVSFKPSYGFLQFFPDGFCKVGHWNGIFTSAAELDEAFDNNPPYVFWGVYKTVLDTLLIEYLYSPATPGRGPIERKYTLAGLIKENEIVIISTDSQKYSYPENLGDSLISSCVGKFVSHPSHDLPKDNYLKKNINKYQ